MATHEAPEERQQAAEARGLRNELLLQIGRRLLQEVDRLRAMQHTEHAPWRLREAEKRLKEAIFWMEEHLGEE